MQLFKNLINLDKVCDFTNDQEDVVVTNKLAINNFHQKRFVFRKTFFNLYEKQSIQLGAGGFGEVYSGKSIADNRPVAIKEMSKKKIEHWIVFKSQRIQMPLEIAILYKYVS